MHAGMDCYLILCYLDTFQKYSVHSCLPDIITYYCVIYVEGLSLMYDYIFLL